MLVGGLGETGTRQVRDISGVAWRSWRISLEEMMLVPKKKTCRHCQEVSTFRTILERSKFLVDFADPSSHITSSAPILFSSFDFQYDFDIANYDNGLHKTKLQIPLSAFKVIDWMRTSHKYMNYS